MKNSLIAFVAALACLFFNSCGETGSHSFQLYHPNPNGLYGPVSYLYADELEDSVVFATTDSYVAKSLTYDWLSLEDNREQVTGKFINDGASLYIVTARVFAKPNDTGKSRDGAVQIKTEKFTGTACYTQFPVFRFRRPSLFYKNDGSIGIELNDSSTVLKDSVVFTIQNDWTMEIAEDSVVINWLSIDKTNGEKGLNAVHLTFSEPNKTAADRHAYLVLQSAGITNRIRINQYKAKK